MSRRKKFQSINWLMGALRNIATDEKISARERLMAIDRAASIDEIYSSASFKQLSNPATEQVPPPPAKGVVDDVDAILNSIQKRGGTNGNVEHSAERAR